MEKEEGLLASFAGSAKGFTDTHRIRVIAVAAGITGRTRVALEITPKNLEEKTHFENHLKSARINFSKTQPKSFETVQKVRRGDVHWRDAGIYLVYELSRRKRAGEFVPECCRRAAKSETPVYLRRNYTYKSYFTRLHRLDKAFQFLDFTPCSPACRKARALNEKIKVAVKNSARIFFRRYTTLLNRRTTLLVTDERDIYDTAKGPACAVRNAVPPGWCSVWPDRDAHDYVLLDLKKRDGKHFFHHAITAGSITIGSRIAAQVRIIGNTADVKILRAHPKPVRVRHLRHHPLMGRGS